jgi:hypothetical protein
MKKFIAFIALCHFALYRPALLTTVEEREEEQETQARPPDGVEGTARDHQENQRPRVSESASPL